MTTGTSTINAVQGLHARPAGELVKLAKKFTGSHIVLSTETKSADAASMLSVLSLGLKHGTVVNVSVEGGDEASALAAVINYLNSFD